MYLWLHHIKHRLGNGHIQNCAHFFVQILWNYLKKISADNRIKLNKTLQIHSQTQCHENK